MIAKYTIDDLEVGFSFNFKQKISKGLIQQFSTLTGDYHPLHTDLEYSRKHNFSDVIAQGFLLCSFLSYIVGMEVPGENAIILQQESKFLKPVFADEDVEYRTFISELDKRFSIITLSYSILNSSLVTCVTGSIKVKIRNSIN